MTCALLFNNISHLIEGNVRGRPCRSETAQLIFFVSLLITAMAVPPTPSLVGISTERFGRCTQLDFTQALTLGQITTLRPVA